MALPLDLQVPPEEDESAAFSQPAQQTSPIKKAKQQRRKKKRLITGAIVLALLAAGGGYYLLNKKPVPKEAPKVTESNQSEETEPEGELVTTTEHYTSSAFRLSLDHPTNWTVDDSAGLSFISPKTKLKNAEGDSTQVRIVVKVRSKGSQVSEVTGDTITAIKASEKIAYTQPSAGQRGQTYLTFASYLTPTGLDGVYITGDNGYEVEGFIPKADLMQSDPMISVSFVTCKDSACDVASSKPTGIQADQWGVDPTLNLVVEMLKSIVVS